MMTIPRWCSVAVGLASLAGFLDASYLAIEHYADSAPVCGILTGCETVTASAYATLEGTVAALSGGDASRAAEGGTPVALFGAMYYLAFFIVAFAAYRGQTRWLTRLLPFSALGILAAVWFLSLQAFVLEAYCVYCLGSAAASSAIFVAFVVLLLWKRRELSAN